MAAGEKNSTWGVIANTQFGLLEVAIAGRSAITHDDTASYSLTTLNGASDEARNMILNIAGALTADRNAVVPTVSQAHIAKNATTGSKVVTLKTSGGTGIAIPNGKTTLLYCDGTNVVNAIDYLNTLTAGTFGVRSSGAAFDMQLANSEVLTANRALTIKLNDAARTVDLGGNLTTAGAFTTSGAFACTLTTTADSNVTLPTSGTLSTGITLGTEQASTSGTSIDFTGIPSWAKRITVNFVGVSTNGAGTPYVQIQIGSGSVDTSGYLSRMWSSNSGVGVLGQTGCFLATGLTSAGTILTGSVTLQLENASNVWVSTGVTCDETAYESYVSAGRKTLSGALDRVRITTQGAGATFDAGAINITYER